MTKYRITREFLEDAGALPRDVEIIEVCYREESHEFVILAEGPGEAVVDGAHREE